MQPITLPELPYDFAALEPVISAEIMQLHYTKHHQAYVNNFNKALASLEQALASADPINTPAEVVKLQSALRFNGGGHINHSIFWSNLAPTGKGGEPSAELHQAIHQAFGGLKQLQERMNAMGLAVQGSGWVWLAVEPSSRRLVVHPMSNQDAITTIGLTPLLGIDVWEHAYYLQYGPARADYLNAIWQIVNWHNVSERYKLAIG